ncbi:hypothetical protein SAMN05428951_11788 [Pseudomonas sp. OV546]|nr:hypothetical protein SAMN05428951_11788 [Pseudomonas sp. OV546]
MWEGACSRWRCISRHLYQLTHCYREQAPSHSLIFIGFDILVINK